MGDTVDMSCSIANLLWHIMLKAALQFYLLPMLVLLLALWPSKLQR